MSDQKKSISSTQALIGYILAIVAGYTDAYGYISYNTYLSFMSGNTTQTGLGLAFANFSQISSLIVAIFFFVGGALSGALMNRSAIFQVRQLVIIVIASLQLLVIGLIQFNLTSLFIQIAILSFSMGLLNTILANIGAQTINLTFVTGTLSRCADHLALAIKGFPLKDAQGPWDTHIKRAGLLLKIWLSFLFGAFLAGYLFLYLVDWSLLLPIFILLFLAAINPWSLHEGS